MNRFFILLVVSFIVGCASVPKGSVFNGEVFLEEETATVYFYRPSTFSLSGRDVNIFIDGVPSKVLNNGTYATVQLEPGTYEFGAKIKPYGLGGEMGVALELFIFKYTIKPNQPYYLGWFSSLNSFVDKPEEYFLVSSKINPDEAFEGVLIDLNAEFGLVKPQFGLPELKKCKLSNEPVNLKKI